MKEELSFLSKDNNTNIHGVIYSCDSAKGIIIYIHGPYDYIDRYEEFAKILNKNGYILAGIDLVGHGKSIKSLEFEGDLVSPKIYKDPEDILLQDLKTFKDKLTNKYANLPIFIIGHSFGGNIAMLFVNNYASDINGLILMNTPFNNSYNIKKIYAYILSNVTEWNKRSLRLYNIVFKKLNKKFSEKYIGVWLSNDKEKINNFTKDRLMYRYTNSYFYTIFNIVNKSIEKENINNISKLTPICLLYGKDDPLTNFGEDYNNICKYFKDNEYKIIYKKIYNGLRNNLIDEVYNDIVYNDLFDFLNRYSK